MSLRDSRGRDADGTERSRFAYSPATVILPETNSTNGDPPRGGFGRLTCDAGVFDASDLTIPLDAIVSVAMFGDDFYDDDTVANHREFFRALGVSGASRGSHCQHTAVNLCNDAGVPTDDGRVYVRRGPRRGRCDACAEGWSATYVVDGGEIGAGEFGNNAGKLVSCDAPDGDASRGAGNKDAPTLVPWAEWALIAGSCVTTALAGVLYLVVTRELKGTPVFAPNISASGGRAEPPRFFR